jgi:two-component system, NtrC family, sensor kinase
MPLDLMAEPSGRARRNRGRQLGTRRESVGRQGSDRLDGTRPEAVYRAADLELERLRSAAVFHQRLRDLTIAFSGAVSSSLSLEGALQTLASDANGLLGARRTSVWLHQRRARRLVLAASSDPQYAMDAADVPTDDPDAPAARGMRLELPAFSPEGEGPLLLVPLRGWRRALGALVVDGPLSVELEEDQRADFAHELARQLSAAIENIQLLDEVLRHRRLLEDTFNSLLDLVIVTDNELRIVQMNDAFVERTMLTRAELMDRSLDSLVGPELAAWVATGDTADSQPDGGRTRRFEEPLLDGTFSVTMTPLINASGAPGGHVLVARDITRETRLEREQAALRERLGQSEKLAALGQFVAGIAHEMNNPLQGVLGHLELLIETSAEARPLRRDLRRIYHEADRAAKIVRNLLVFAGSRRMTRRRLRMNRVLSRAISSRAASLSRASIELTRDEAPDLPAVMGDSLLMHQAVLNILINAEHAILAAGIPGRIEVTSNYDPNTRRVVTTVKDSGPGIPADALPRIFDPFFTTKEVGKGTGLGLAITYGIIQEHGGAITAANAADGGAIFTITLPAAEA